jgi:hypothetical protein
MTASVAIEATRLEGDGCKASTVVDGPPAGSLRHRCPYAIEESTRQPRQWRHCGWPATAGREHMRQMCASSTVAAWLRRRARDGTSALVPLRLL